jgi:hypothetical protein
MIWCEECGRPARCRPRNRGGRTGYPHSIKGHTLCQNCNEALLQRFEAGRLLEIDEMTWKELVPYGETMLGPEKNLPGSKGDKP